jgi:ATP-dependent DNA ligase
VETKEGARGAGGGDANDLPTRRLSDNGLKAWAQAVHRGYEGVVGKDPESPYVPGRTLKWLKVKQKDYRKEARGFYRE